MAESGLHQAATFRTLQSALRKGGAGQGHVITEASPVITPPWKCPPVITKPVWQQVVDASILAAASSDAHMTIAYGASVRSRLEDRHLRQHEPGEEQQEDHRWTSCLPIDNGGRSRYHRHRV